MRYVIVDLEGASRDYFDSREDAREAILEIEEDTPGAAAEVFVVAYDENGQEVEAPMRGDDLLTRPILDWGPLPPHVVVSVVNVVTGASSTTHGDPDPPMTREVAGASR